MKRFSFLVGCLFICMATFAQQALWGGKKNIVSPEVHGDNTVTFRLDAPNATKVQVTGDFLPVIKRETPWGVSEEAGVVELVKNNEGIW